MEGSTNVGTDSPTYSIPSVVTADAGNYTVVVANGCGSKTSDIASLTVNKASTTTSITCPTGVTYNGFAQTPCSASVSGPGGLTKR